MDFIFTKNCSFFFVSSDYRSKNWRWFNYKHPTKWFIGHCARSWACRSGFGSVRFNKPGPERNYWCLRHRPKRQHDCLKYSNWFGLKGIFDRIREFYCNLNRCYVFNEWPLFFPLTAYRSKNWNRFNCMHPSMHPIKWFISCCACSWACNSTSFNETKHYCCRYKQRYQHEPLHQRFEYMPKFRFGFEGTSTYLIQFKWILSSYRLFIALSFYRKSFQKVKSMQPQASKQTIYRSLRV